MGSQPSDISLCEGVKLFSPSSSPQVPSRTYRPVALYMLAPVFSSRYLGNQVPPFGPALTFFPTQLTKGRPLTGLSLSIFPEDYCYSFKAVTRTSAPIKRLTVLILGSIPPSELFLNIAKYMPLLEALHVVSPFGMDSSVRIHVFLMVCLRIVAL